MVLVERLRYVEALGEPLPLHPGYGIADLQPGILQCTCQPVNGPGAAERDDMTTGDEHPQTFPRPLLTGRQRIPLFAHEAETIGRVGDDGGDRGVRHRAHHLDTVPAVEPVTAKLHHLTGPGDGWHLVG